MYYYYLYKITNKLNGKIYIGAHKTKKLDDGYMGSGVYLKKDQLKYGIENFEKEILEFFDSQKELFEAERFFVNSEFIKRDDTYNVSYGGTGGWDHMKGMVTVKDKDNNFYSVSIDDPRYLSGELIHITTDMVGVKDKNDNRFMVNKDDPRYLSGELIPISTGRVTVKDKDNNFYSVSIDDPRYLSGELIPISTNMIIVKDKNDNRFMVNKDNPRYLSGELIPIWCGKKHKESSKRKIGDANSIHQKGKGNSQYGTMWIYNLALKQNKKIKKTDCIPEGWIKGRKIKF